jgi:hypothetical protein
MMAKLTSRMIRKNSSKIKTTLLGRYIFLDWKIRSQTGITMNDRKT